MIGNKWDEILKPVFDNKEFLLNYKEILKLYNEKTIYPNKDDIFRALKLTDFDDVKVVILGQDPYHNGQADGLAFSSTDSKVPASLKNIFLELNKDLNIPKSDSADLSNWAREGVLLLNTVLTVEKGKPNSHKKYKWDLLTDYIIMSLSAREKPVVFILWGEHAKSKLPYIDQTKNFVITGSHPSPLSVHRGGFFNEGYFSKSNIFLEENDMEAISYKL